MIFTLSGQIEPLQTKIKELEQQLDKARKDFEERLIKIDWDKYCDDRPFNPSALSLYEWAPIADELKTLDRKIVLNSVILKWDVIKKELKDRVQF